jgi:WD40 repeat protein
MSDDENKIPDDFLCPITLEIMTDPVVAADGQTYERKSITNWLSRKKGRSPLDGSDLSHDLLTDNIFARKVIKEFQSRLPEQRNVRSKLEKCIRQKDEMIKSLLEKINNLNKNQTNTNTNVILDLKKENLALKKQNIQLEEAIIDLKKEIDELKKAPIHINIHPTELLYKKYTSTDDKNYKKCSSYKLDNQLRGILELNDGTISCFTDKEIKLFKNTGNNSFELIKSFPLKIDYWTSPIQLENGNIIFRSGWNELTHCNKDFKVIETYKEYEYIRTLCKISKLSYAIGLPNGIIKIYSRNEKTQKYDIYKEYKYHSYRVYSLLYLPKQNFLLSGLHNRTINVLSLSEGWSIKKLTDHNSPVFSLISLNDETFASGSFDGVIKIWFIKGDTSIECITTIKAHEENIYGIDLNVLGNEFIISRSGIEFKIWNVSTHECIKTFYEDSLIDRLIVTKNQNIITATEDNKVNMWKILV